MANDISVVSEFLIQPVLSKSREILPYYLIFGEYITFCQTVDLHESETEDGISSLKQYLRC